MPLLKKPMKKKFIEDNLVIRSCAQTNTPTIFSLIKRLAIDQQKTHKFHSNSDDFKKIYNTTSLNINAIIAGYKETPISVCLYFFNFSTWRGETGIYIQDLFVEVQYRRNNIANTISE